MARPQESNHSHVTTQDNATQKMIPVAKEYHSSSNDSNDGSTSSTSTARMGDIVTVDLDLTPEDGFVPESFFDTKGKISFVLGWGNYLPGLHELIVGMSVGEEKTGISLDAGYGQRSPDMVFSVPKSNFKKLQSIDSLQVGAVLNLQGGVQVTVSEVTEDTVVVDANHPLAGSSYACSVKIIDIGRFPTPKLEYPSKEQTPSSSPEENDYNDNSTNNNNNGSRYEVATWAMGCFWGGELAFMRTPGVVGTRVGYTQGSKANPTYEEVCAGGTRHRESIMVVYDPEVVSYNELANVFMERLAVTFSQYTIDIFDEEEDESLQYKHGIYYHNEEQRRLAEEVIASNNNRYKVELLQSAVFYEAEEYHQQYLLKGGQSARKNAKETIRCFG